MVRTLVSQSRGPRFNPLVAILKLGQFCSINIASVHFVVEMSTWLYTGVDSCE